ncbi:saccharopine dehydrogenase family protein [Halorientalis persicus]|uniref:saccharopine dehydrogenase family protein n=1 Tax=Halorientalis persicus TaxID=1367881 RepID=UPI000B895762|nr:saccharopine dehydrogenase NADP-binding domain-containing protein [Halorientalis persicus]
MSNTDRRYDLVVWGATGVAGRLVAEYLTEQYTPDTLSLALGGRNETRLQAVESDLVDGSDEWESVPIVLGDATVPETLRELARETRVVCTTVGPYTTYGTPLVEACVEAGTEYCDLTGEVNWTREIVDEYHDAAVDADTRIVHSCGFDSVPADLGTLLAQSFARAEFGAPCSQVRIYVESGSGGVSGGTLASAAELFEAASNDPEVRRVLGNPYSLAPPGEREGVDPGEQRLPRKDPLRSSWTAPSPMAPVNERVVRRSNALLEYPWGRGFRCTEVIPTGPGLGGAATAGLISGGLGLFTLAMSIGPTRSALERFVFPDPGDGPSEEQMEQGHFRVRVRGQGTNEDGPFTVDAVIGADRDPGYGGTARMLGESAMCLVEDDTDSPLSGGVLTPASAIGKPLAERLRAVGFTASASVVSEDVDS